MESFNLNEYLSIRSAVERLGGGGGGGGSGVQSLTAGAGIDISGASGNLTITNTNPLSPQLVAAISQYIYPTIDNITDQEPFVIPGYSITFTPTTDGYIDLNGYITVQQSIYNTTPTVYWTILAFIFMNGNINGPPTSFGNLTTSPATYATLPIGSVKQVSAGNTYLIRLQLFTKNVQQYDCVYSSKMSVVFYPNATPLTPS